MNHVFIEEVYVINKYIELEDYDILVKEVQVYNLENNTEHFMPWFSDYLTNSTLSRLLVRVGLFYWDPYVGIENGTEYKVIMEVIGEKGQAYDHEDSHLILVPYEELPVVNFPRRGHGTSRSDNTNILDFSFRGPWLSESYAGISLKDEDTDELVYLTFENKPFKKMYTFFSRKNRRLKASSDETCSSLIGIYNYAGSDEAEIYVHTSNLDKFNWHLLDGIDPNELIYLQMSHIRKGQEFGEIFEMSIETGEGSYLTFEMVYEDRQWWVLSVN